MSGVDLFVLCNYIYILFYDIPQLDITNFYLYYVSKVFYDGVFI